MASADYNDFRSELHKNGFAIIKNAITHDRAVKYQEKAYAWLKSFPGDLDFAGPETWVEKNLPRQNSIKTYAYYCVAHENFMWDAKQEQGVLKAFSTLWNTEELLVSFDSLNITFPNRKDVPRRAPWQHVDQSPLRRGIHCVQGIINLSPSGPEDGGLVVYPGSHLLMDEFFDTMTDKSTWLPLKDIHLFQAKELAWFEERGCQPHKVCAEVGDLILWDSRVIHYGSEPTEKSSQIRTAIYATYTPASFASSEQLELKKRVFESYGGTTHWPHQHIVERPTQVFLPDGTRDPRDRDQPLELPEMTDKLLKLAGAKLY